MCTSQLTQQIVPFSWDVEIAGSVPELFPLFTTVPKFWMSSGLSLWTYNYYVEQSLWELFVRQLACFSIQQHEATFKGILCMSTSCGEKAEPELSCTLATLIAIVDMASTPCVALIAQFPSPGKLAYSFPHGYITIYEDYILRGFRWMFYFVLVDICCLSGISLSQLTPTTWGDLTAYQVHSDLTGIPRDGSLISQSFWLQSLSTNL